MGRTVPLSQSAAPFLRIVSWNGEPCDEPEDAVSADGLVIGTSVHGLFGNSAFRPATLAARRVRVPAMACTPTTQKQVLDGLASLIARHLDLDRLRHIIGLCPP